MALFINALSIAVFTAVAYWQERDSFLRGVDDKLHVAANSLPYLLPDDYLASITGPESIAPDRFVKTQNLLTEYVKANGLAFLYCVVEMDGRFYFVASSTDENELASGTQARFYEVYKTPPLGVIEAWRTNREQVTEYADAYGKFRSIFVPIQIKSADDSRDMRFILGSDIYVSFIDRELQHTIILCMGIGCAIFILTAVVTQPTLTRLLAPIGRLTRNTQELVEGSFHLSDGQRSELASMATAKQDEVGKLAFAFAEMIKQLELYISDLRTVTAAKERIESEMKIAGDIQQSFVPQHYQPKPGQLPVDLDAVLMPAKQVGGDLYDFFYLDNDRLFFAIGDVSDKGAPAALFMAVTLTLLRTLINNSAIPDRLLSATNRSLSEHNEAYQFVTLFCGVLDIQTGIVQYAHGGHNPPYVFSPKLGHVQALEPVDGMALGAFATATYHTQALQLAADEVLLLYTDGVTEAMNAARELYGEERLETCLKSIGENATTSEITQAVLDDVAAHIKEAPPSDDLTMLCIRLLPGPAS